MTDFLYRGLFAEGCIRFSYALTTQLVTKAVKLHDCGPLTAHAFGRALTAGTLAAPLLADDERYSIAWRYPGALGTLVVELGAESDVRGLVTNPTIMDKVEDESQIYGEGGTVSMVKSNDRKVLRQSTTEAALLDVVDDLGLLYALSDQVETGMSVLIGLAPDPEKPITICQGLMLQALPACHLPTFERFRQAMGSKTFRHLLAQQPEADNHTERLLQALGKTCGEPLGQLELHGCEPPVYRCGCTREKTRDLLRTIPRAELRKAAREGETMTIACHFCRTRYEFDAGDLHQHLSRD